MAKMAQMVAGVALVALVPAMAVAGGASGSRIVNDQLNTGGVSAATTLHAPHTAGASASTLGAGNAMNASAVQQGVDVSSRQILRGPVRAVTTVDIGAARGATVAAGVAQGNAAQIAGCCATITGRSDQVAEEGADVSAYSNVRVGSADTVVSAASASANNLSIHSARGIVDYYAGQYSSSRVTAVSTITACCNNGSLTSGATAAGNNAAATGESATVYMNVDQSNMGAVVAYSGVDAGSATNVTSAAAAAGNLASVQNEWGYAQLGGYQENSAPVSATSEVFLHDWDGFAVSGANAIGNSAIVSTVGSDAQVALTQNNFGGGGVSASASLVGSSSQGGVGMATASATGNAITAATCTSCGSSPVGIQAYTSQYNYAPVTATATIMGGSSGALVGSATAVGNSATFIARQGGH